MSDEEKTRKHVVVHIGPHKTGSKSIQAFFRKVQTNLNALGVHFLESKLTQEACVHFLRDKADKAEVTLRAISSEISQLDAETIFISQADFCGELPGRTHSQQIYPKLTQNLRLISGSLEPHVVSFVFFLRDEHNWLESCYHQHLQSKFRFFSFADFIANFEEPLSWRQKLQRPKRIFQDALIIVPYSKERDAGMRSILNLLKADKLLSKIPTPQENVSPNPEKVRLLERINSLSSFKSTSWFAKSLVLNDWQPRPAGTPDYPSWHTNRDLSFAGLPSLSERASKRIVKQKVSDILPRPDVDLWEYVFDTLPNDAALPDVPRTKMEDQSRILDYHLRGKSRLAKLNALTISYLRRDTAHTDKARELFHRVWREHGILLVNELSTRWLISTLQTFLDHGQNEAQRMIGASGHFYANMMKIYEGERAIEGLEQDAIYHDLEPKTPNKFRGLDRYHVGGTDLLLNTNALALDLAARDDVAGLVLVELLLRVKDSGNVFTRMDRTRKVKGVSVSGFTDTWSFFEPLK